jgi:hypothetical protein
MLESCCERLRRHYNDRTPLYWDLWRLALEGGHDVRVTDLPIGRDDGAITMAQMIWLFRAVKGEFQEVL